MILIVEDDADNASALRDVLQDEGYVVSRANNGIDALRQLKSGPLPGLILLDLMMPEMDGSHFAKAVRDEEAWKHIPMVVLSASGRAAERAATPGIERFLHKPVDLTTLLDVINTHYREP